MSPFSLQLPAFASNMITAWFSTLYSAITGNIFHRGHVYVDQEPLEHIDSHYHAWCIVKNLVQRSHHMLTHVYHPAAQFIHPEKLRTILNSIASFIFLFLYLLCVVWAVCQLGIAVGAELELELPAHDYADEDDDYEYYEIASVSPQYRQEDLRFEADKSRLTVDYDSSGSESQWEQLYSESQDDLVDNYEGFYLV